VGDPRHLAAEGDRREEQPGYEFFGTTADKGILARGRDLRELFVNAARGLMALMVEDPAAVLPAERRAVRLVAGSSEGLLVAWLSELLYLYEVDGFLVADAVLDRLDETGLAAHLAGEPFDPGRHRAAGHVKAVTYHGLEITRDADGLRAPIIVDV
jgi:SHS2 domain-containing protein